MRLRSANAMPRTGGFTLLELVVVIVIIAVLLATAAHRLLPYLDEAERVSVLTVESQLKNVLVMEAAERIVGGRSATIAELEGSNPMALLLEAPDNYIGERQPGADLPERRWYFDTTSRRLVYKTGAPWTPGLSESGFTNPEFEVRVIFEDRDADGVFDATKDELFGVRLLRAAGAGWLAMGG